MSEKCEQIIKGVIVGLIVYLLGHRYASLDYGSIVLFMGQWVMIV